MHAIRKLFNPDYRIVEDPGVIGEWVSREDIENCSLGFVNEVWKGSADLAQKVVEEFDQWERENQ